jgi:hypothetical protein
VNWGPLPYRIEGLESAGFVAVHSFSCLLCHVGDIIQILAVIMEPVICLADCDGTVAVVA